MSAFQIFVRHLDEPFRTIACVCVCFGLRISECLALRWSDINWLEGKLSIQEHRPSDFVVCKLVKTGGSVCESNPPNNLYSITYRAADGT
jgi:integrase